jgi:polar amino acid transport system permease protein
MITGQGTAGFGVVFQAKNFERLMAGLGLTLEIALVAAVLSIVLGLILGYVASWDNKITRAITTFYLNFIRIMPQLVLLFIVYYGSKPALGLDLTAQFSAIFVFTIWGTAEVMDLVRGAIETTPRGQIEAGLAVGLTDLQVARIITIPQTIQRLIPAFVNLITRMVKTTAIVPLIGIVDIVKVGQQLIDFNRFADPQAAIYIYTAIFFIYFIICFPITQLARFLEKRLS